MVGNRTELAYIGILYFCMSRDVGISSYRGFIDFNAPINTHGLIYIRICRYNRKYRYTRVKQILGNSL